MQATETRPGFPERAAAAIAALAPILAMAVVLAWPWIHRAFRPRTTHVLLCCARSTTVFLLYASVLLMAVLTATFVPLTAGVLPSFTRTASAIQSACTTAIALLALVAPSIRIPVLDDVAENIVARRTP